MYKAKGQAWTTICTKQSQEHCTARRIQYVNIKQTSFSKSILLMLFLFKPKQIPTSSIHTLPSPRGGGALWSPASIFNGIGYMPIPLLVLEAKLFALRFECRAEIHTFTGVRFTSMNLIVTARSVLHGDRRPILAWRSRPYLLSGVVVLCRLRCRIFFLVPLEVMNPCVFQNFRASPCS